jgi:hypothetical protein
LASVYEKIKVDDLEQGKVLSRAEEHRKFLLSFGEGVLSPSLKTLDGLWKFPSVEIDLICNGKEIVGIKEIQTQVHTDYGLTAILGGGPPKPVTRTERFEFSGNLTGRTCKFKLSASKHDDPSAAWTPFSGMSGDQTIEGYILFAEDGRSGRVAELKGDKPEKYYEVSKLP